MDNNILKKEFSQKEIQRKKRFYESQGSTNVHIYNPIVRVGKFMVGMEITYNVKIYKIHSFNIEGNKANLTLLTKNGKPDLRAKGIYITI